MADLRDGGGGGGGGLEEGVCTSTSGLARCCAAHVARLVRGYLGAGARE